MGEALDPQTLSALLHSAEAVARKGGEVLLDYQARMQTVRTEFKGRRTELVTEADRAAEEVVVAPLLQEWPSHRILAEEGVLTPQGQPSEGDEDFLWIIDPIDGTTNFVHRLPFFCVAVGLCYRGDPVVGVVHAPVLDWTFTAAQGLGARRNGEPIQVTRTDELGKALIATGFSYNRSEPGADDNLGRVTKALHQTRDLRRSGSAELDLCMTGAGHYDGYWELYLQPYDVAAGAVVLREAGGRVTDLAGGDDWLYGETVLASNGHLHEDLLDLVGDR